MKYFTVFCALLVGTWAYAQETKSTKKIYTVRTQQNQTYQGELISENEQEMQLKDLGGVNITILKSQIKRIEIDEVSITTHKKVWLQTPNRTRYLLTPTGFGLKKKEGYYQNVYFFLNNFNYGLTDHVSLGGGVEVISLFAGSPIFFLMPKLSLPISPKWNAAGGLLYMNMLGKYNPLGRGFGIGYGVLTYGTENTNITAGLGYGFYDREWTKRPIFTLSGTVRLSNRVALVSENWVIPDGGAEQYFVSYGARFMWRKLAFDVAFIRNPLLFDDTFYLGVPFLDLVVKF